MLLKMFKVVNFRGAVAQTMHTHVSKCKSDEIKKKLKVLNFRAEGIAQW
jgi:hypothetical protein